MILAGDTFHVRGSIDPEVFNPTHEAFTRILAKGVKVIAIPGNHDLRGKETTEIGNAIQTLSALEGFTVISKPTFFDHLGLALIPWQSTPDALRAQVTDMRDNWGLSLGEIDLVIHAPVNGVVNIPDHGLNAEEIAAWGFKRVASGHHHNHKVMESGKVISIGASSHQTWGDIGTKAGFILFDDNEVHWRGSNAPAFVEVNEDTDEDEIPLIVDGNYVRIRGKKMTDSEINLFRKELIEMGAKGVRFDIAREVVSARSAGKPTKALSLEGSVVKYIDESTMDNKDDVKTLCASLLAEVHSIAA